VDGTAVIVELYSRLPELAHHAVDGASLDALTTPPAPDANTIAWLVWHPARVLDDHVGDVMGTEQLWCEGIWPSRFDLAPDPSNTGYGHTPEQVLAIRPSAPRWDPPVTLAVRLLSVADDCLQHLGQAAYARGILDR
jgi:Protein of unknown function (DUF664)